MLQLHLMIVYVTSGIEKGSGAQWWNGEAIWRALTRTDLGYFEVTWLARVSWLPMVIGWATVVMEAGYGIGVWLPMLGRIWLVSIILMHVGIALAISLSFFACVMI